MTVRQLHISNQKPLASGAIATNGGSGQNRNPLEFPRAVAETKKRSAHPDRTRLLAPRTLTTPRAVPAGRY